MATTVVMPPTNTESYASKFVPRLDEIYKRGALTAILDTPAELVDWIGAKTVNLFTFSSVGMANYDRNAGYVTGNINAGWEPFAISIDRGRSFQIDEMSNEEVLGMSLSSLLRETERVEVIPEVDAYVFSKLAGSTGISSATGALTASADVIAAIDAAEAQMDNDEVPYESRILFVSPDCYMKLKGGIERRIVNSENNVNTNVEFYDDMQIIRVPKKRFNTAITLNAPTTPDGVGGFTATGSDINFMIVDPGAVMKVMKHRLSNVFTPAQNIEADAYRVNFRFYHDVFLKPQKAKGVFVHSAS